MAQLWGVASAVKEPGATLEFRFWAHNGALTLESWQRLKVGSGVGRPVSSEDFAKGLEPHLPVFLGERTKEVVITLRRESTRWMLDYEAHASREPLPPHAKSWPVRRTGVTGQTHEAVHRVAGSLVRLLQVPSDGTATLHATVELEDDRVEGWEPGRYESSGHGGARPPPSSMVSEVVNALLPFTHGVGRRTVQLELRGSHGGPATFTRGWVVRAQTLHPPPPPESQAEFVAEYRAMHEEILCQWREGVRDGFQMAATFTAEQFALWCIGGLAARGATVLFKAVAPTVTRVLARGGSEAAGWLRSLLARAPAERGALTPLMAKLDAGGLQALTAAERAELTALMGRLEQLIQTPLTTAEKGRLRAVAHANFFERFHPELAKVLRTAKDIAYPVHHRIPLEFAHLFPTVDVNARLNLIAADPVVHTGINRVWTLVRPVRQRLTPAEVEQVVAIVDRHFGRWYNVVHEPGRSASALSAAEASALGEVERLLVQLGKGS